MSEGAMEQQQVSVGRRIAAIEETTTNLQGALGKVDYADEDLWDKCRGKVKRLARELRRLQE